MKIALATDHTGVERSKRLKEFLQSLGHTVVDFGPQQIDPDDDYPDYIFPAAKAIASGECELGIILGGSGQGEAMAANRIRGVRSAVYYGPARPVETVDAEGRNAADELEILRLSRQHNNANILSLAARFLTQDDIQQAVSVWLETSFSGTDRHQRRIAKLDSGA